MTDVVARLKAPSEKHVVTSEAKLHQLAQRFAIAHKPADLRAALEANVGKQILAPQPRYQGVSAAEKPGSRIQIDLADMHNGALDKVGAHHYALVATDVFTRQTYATPMRYKTAESTDAALKGVLAKFPGRGEGATVTSDKGREFSSIDSVLDPLHAVHRQKQALNDISVVDRAMGTLKAKLAAARANQGGTWSKPLQQVVEGYNETPHPTVHGAPATADEDGSQKFLIYQDQARNFEKNRATTDLRKSRLETDGAFRDAIPHGGRRHKPAYGAVHELDRIEPGALHVIGTDGTKALLKKVQAVPKGSEEPKAVFETKVHVRKPEDERAKRPHKPMTKKIPEAASREFQSSGSGMSAEQRAELAPESMTAPKPPHPISVQIQTYTPQRTAAERAASAKETAAKKAAKALQVAHKKSAALQIQVDKEIAKHKKAVEKELAKHK